MVENVLTAMLMLVEVSPELSGLNSLLNCLSNAVMEFEMCVTLTGKFQNEIGDN